MDNKDLIDTNPQTRTRPATVTAVYYSSVRGNRWFNRKPDLVRVRA